MAIPAMISKFGQQQVDYGAAIGASLAQLGQQVGQQLAMQEYRKQAAAELPFMQEAMKGAMNKINAGDVSGGYMEAMMALPLGSQNPIVASAAENYFKGLQQAAEFKQSSLWNQLQREQMMGRGGTGSIGFRVPSAEELSDPNAIIETDAVYVDGGIPAMGGVGNGQMIDPDVQAERDLMALQPVGQDEKMSFGFGTLSQFKPKDDVIRATQNEITRYNGLSPEDKIDYTQTIAETDIGYRPPQGRKAEPFQGIVGFDGVSYIEGPVTGGQKVAAIEEEYSEKGRKIKRKLEPADKSDEQTFDAFIQNIDKANSFASRNPQLRRIIEASGGDLTRVDIQDEEDPDTLETVFKAYVDGTDMGVLSTEENFNEKAALEMLADAPAVIRRNGWKVIKSESPAEAPAEGAPKTIAERVRSQFGKAQQPAPAAEAPAPPARELTLAEQISDMASTPAPSPREQPERRGPTATRVSQELTKERDELRRALYQMTGRGKARVLKRGLDPENPVVKRGIERLKEIEKELSSL